MLFSLSTAILLALSTLSPAAPLTSRQSNPPSPQDIADAANEWAADTSKVSQFLSAASSLSGSDLATQAATALSNELDELTHKAILDEQFNTADNPGVEQANNVLAGPQQTFQIVVDGLTNLANNGASMTPDQVAAEVQAINEDRCTFVLPAIDAYFLAVSDFLQNGLTLVANRPDNCP